MAFFQGTVSYNTTGVKTITVGFQPQCAEIVLAPAPGSANTTQVRYSFGSTDGTLQTCDSYTVESSRRRQERLTNRLAAIYTWNGSAWAEDVGLTIDSFTATELKINMTTGNNNYQLHVKVWG